MTEAAFTRDLAVSWPTASSELISDPLSLHPLSSFGPPFRAANDLSQDPFLPIFNAIALTFNFNLTIDSLEPFQNQAIVGDYTVLCTFRYIASAAFNSTPTKVPIWKLRFNAAYHFHSSVDFYFLGAPNGLLIRNETLAVIWKDHYLSFVINQDANMGLERGLCRAGLGSLSMELSMTFCGSTRQRLRERQMWMSQRGVISTPQTLGF